MDIKVGITSDIITATILLKTELLKAIFLDYWGIFVKLATVPTS